MPNDKINPTPTSNIAGSNINVNMGSTSTACLIHHARHSWAHCQHCFRAHRSFQMVWYQFNIMHEAVTATTGVHQGGGRVAQSPFRVLFWMTKQPVSSTPSPKEPLFSGTLASPNGLVNLLNASLFSTEASAHCRFPPNGGLRVYG